MVNLLVRILKAAVPCGAAAFLFCLPATGQEKTSHSVAKQVIEEAQKLALKGRRGLAQKKLIGAIGKLQVSDEQHKALVTSLNQLSWTFLTDNAQALYESGESFHYSGKLREAQDRYQQASKAEPENTRITAALVRNLLSLKKCGGAKSAIEAGLLFHPFDKTLRLLALRAELCKGSGVKQPKQWDIEATTLAAHRPKVISWYRLLLADQDNRRMEVLSFAEKWRKQDRDFPEPLYLLWKHSPRSPDRKEWATEYISRCKKSDQMFRRRYKDEPLLCLHMKTLEEALAKGAGS